MYGFGKDTNQYNFLDGYFTYVKMVFSASYVPADLVPYFVVTVTISEC